jgi:FkbM family methyltransferase
MYMLSLKGLGVDNQLVVAEKGERTFLKNVLSKGSETLTVIDIGANVGNYSIRVKELAKTAKVYAFEPHPETHERLKANASAFDFIPVRKGCGDKSETLKFYDYQEGSGSEHASLLKGVIEDIHHAKSKEFEIEVIRLDDFIEQEKIDKIDLLKIDTEGYEYSVLIGCEKAIAKGKIEVIHFEFNSMNMISRVFIRDFTKLLPQYGLYRILENGLIPIETDRILMSEIFGWQNIVAIKN